VNNYACCIEDFSQIPFGIQAGCEFNPPDDFILYGWRLCFVDLNPEIFKRLPDGECKQFFAVLLNQVMQTGRCKQGVNSGQASVHLFAITHNRLVFF
jgi:hypothetical protein